MDTSPTLVKPSNRLLIFSLAAAIVLILSQSISGGRAMPI